MSHVILLPWVLGPLHSSNVTVGVKQGEVKRVDQDWPNLENRKPTLLKRLGK
jgi:hypothetical protein